ncbi:MAG: S9 family peptidase [Planctomycetes bacterium]|nr:S9 family peptidase [Planctomycetota bacterium]
MLHPRLPFCAALLFSVACRTAPPAPEGVVDTGAVRVESPEGGELTLERCFALSAKLRAPFGLVQGWTQDGSRYLTVKEVAGAKRLVACDPKTGDATPLFDAALLERALVAAGATPEQAKEWSSRTSFDFSPKQDALLLQEANDLWVWPLGAEVAVRATHDDAEEQDPRFSPDAKSLAFVRDYNVFVVGLDGAPPRQLTTDGGAERYIGRLDWVYQEEVYGRGNFNGLWWSPDSKSLAVLDLDEKPVPEIVINDHRGVPHWKDEHWRYPKAGDPNPIARLWVIDAATGERREVDLSGYPEDDRLIVRVGWKPDSSAVMVQVQNRVQTWLDLLAAPTAGGAPKRILRDATSAWIEPVDGFEWFDEGRKFLWLSERDGFKHLYLYDAGGTLSRRLTSGSWEVDELLGYDPATQRAYFLGDRDDVKGDGLFWVGLDGRGITRIGGAGGQHAISMSPSFAFYADTRSSIGFPGSVTLHSIDGEQLAVLWKADPKLVQQAVPSTPTFVKVKTRDGFEMEALMIKPANFDARKKYPVLCHTYSGPHSPQVRDGWGGFNLLFHELLAQQGYLIWICDNRSASGKGHASAAGVWKNLGSQELADLEDGLAWLVAQGYADPARVGIWGWSYGGYMTSFALTHSKSFKMGIAGAPVTDWRFYDSIYTERYMDLPQVNAKGYDASSVVKAAKDLSGELLVIHGAIDENVHMQNTLQLAEALQKAGKQFRLMIYPGNRHGVSQPDQRKHLYAMMLDFIREKL